MLQALLISEKDGQGTPVGESLVIGRNDDCGLVLHDPSASRRHVEITQHGDGFVWRDLGSSNGTLFNGQPAEAGALHDGDRLQIGESVLRFELTTAGTNATPKEDSKLFNKTILDTGAAHAPVETPAEVMRSTKLLEAVYTVVNEIATNYDPCTLMNRILETTLPAIQGQRGIILLAGADTQWLACPVCGLVHRIEGGQLSPAPRETISLSRTVARRVLEHGESVLYKDAAPDGELEAAESIMAMNLRSIICVPLRAKHGILGLLYIDSDRDEKIYSQEDMLLAAAVGNSAGIALENAQMHRQMLDKQRIEQEIATAWTIQEGFLVKDWPDLDKRFQVYGETRPAKTVGGDFYDFVQPAENLIGIMIGDVSGKGVPAALTMAQLIAQFRLHARETHAPAEVIYHLNETLGKQSRRGLFCSLCYLLLDIEHGVARWANAGHPPAVRLGAEEATLFGGASGPPLGILPGQHWAEETLQLAPGETVLLYTDGIVEARSSATVPMAGVQAPEFGEEGLYWKCGELAGKTPREVVDGLQKAVLDYCAPLAPHDDCTLIAVRYLKP